MTKISMSDRNNRIHTKPSDINKAPIRSEPSKFSLIAVITEFSTRGFSVLCSNDSVNTGPSEVTVFVWTIRSAMDWRDKDYQSLAPKKTPTLINKVYYFRTAIRHECPVSGSINPYSNDSIGVEKQIANVR